MKLRVQPDCQRSALNSPAILRKRRASRPHKTIPSASETYIAFRHRSNAGLNLKTCDEMPSPAFRIFSVSPNFRLGAYRLDYCATTSDRLQHRRLQHPQKEFVSSLFAWRPVIALTKYTVSLHNPVVTESQEKDMESDITPPKRRSGVRGARF